MTLRNSGHSHIMFQETLLTGSLKLCFVPFKTISFGDCPFEKQLLLCMNWIMGTEKYASASALVIASARAFHCPLWAVLAGIICKYALTAIWDHCFHSAGMLQLNFKKYFEGISINMNCKIGKHYMQACRWLMFFSYLLPRVNSGVQSQSELLWDDLEIYWAMQFYF